jgi:hypothetical protein
MLILFDNGVPRNLARFLAGHSVEEARARGWDKLSNGKLIDIAEQTGFEALVTTDKNIRFQQNLKTRKIALVVLAHSTVAHGEGGCGKNRRSCHYGGTRQLCGSRRTVQGIRPDRPNEVTCIGR